MITIETELLQWLCQALGLAMVEETADGTLRANKEACEVLGSVLPEQPLSATIAHVLGSSHRAVIDEQIAKAREGHPGTCGDGSKRTFLLLPIANRKVALVIAPQKQRLSIPYKNKIASSDYDIEKGSTFTRSHLSDAEAGTIHELANAVGAISGWTRLAREGNRIPEALDLIQKAADTAVMLARQMLDCARNQAINEGIDLSALVEEGAMLLEPRAAQVGVKITKHIQPELMVRGARDALWSVVSNPLTNAIEAMPLGGDLLITLSMDGKRVKLLVEDTGPGMDENTIERIFHPYFTTKRTGTGLGMVLVKEAVQQLGGVIGVSSVLGRGTRIEIDLPLWSEVKPLRQTASPTATRKRLSGRILVVDDDRAMREMLATALSVYGAEVVNAASASQAIETRGGFELALVDIHLPDRSGEALLAELITTGKARTGLLVSGTDITDRSSLSVPAFRLLRKPFQLDDLFDQVASLLDEKQKQRAPRAPAVT
jgi:CheY-like chemotaxis protein